MPRSAALPILEELTGGHTPPLPAAEARTRFRAALAMIDAHLKARFQAGEHVAILVPERAALMDRLLQAAWRQTGGDRLVAALVAVGGYGRGELHPYSDIDLMILMAEDAGMDQPVTVADFLTFLWDLGLTIGHSVRTVAECAREAAADVTVMTSLLEARFLAGEESLFVAMRAAHSPLYIWSSAAFFRAKREEHRLRHEKYGDTAQSLEPNIKEAPGGLRDIQEIGWVAKRHFGADNLCELMEHGFLNGEELDLLLEGQYLLWRIRMALHYAAGRREERLLFEYQRTIADLFGYTDNERNQGVEEFMRIYYRTVREVIRLNEMLLEIFQEVVLEGDREAEIEVLNKRFQIRNGYLDVRDPEVFKRYPTALLEIFLLLQQHQEIEGVRATTIRLIRAHRYLIDDAFRRDPRARGVFLKIIRQPRRIGHELHRMLRYGVLEAYLPVYERVAGLMQFDLFHVYTVDEHSLTVVRFLRRFSFPRPEDHFPLCMEVMAGIPEEKRYLLYIAGLFHDIGKGQGGDHSQRGEELAEGFCVLHRISPYDTRLVGWLVRHHLVMSRTAQRKDVDDPEEIQEFAALVCDRTHLDFLFLLTVADICGTNPTLWNDWKEMLLSRLYRNTLRAIRRGLDNPIDKEELLREVKDEAMALLEGAGYEGEVVADLWEELSEGYFLRHAPQEIAWQTRAILGKSGTELPVVEVREEGFRGGSDVFLFTHDQDYLFGTTTALLDRLGLTIQDARIIATGTGYGLFTYTVLEAATMQPIEGGGRCREIASTLRKGVLAGDVTPPPNSRRPSRRLKHFTIPVEVGFTADEKNQRTILELIATDRPGLLSLLGATFRECGVRLHNAKIATFGERVEDFFHLTDLDNRPLVGPEIQARLRRLIVARLTPP
jgi:[protein-PII] uridylyltransferase